MAVSNKCITVVSVAFILGVPVVIGLDIHRRNEETLAFNNKQIVEASKTELVIKQEPIKPVEVPKVVAEIKEPAKPVESPIKPVVSEVKVVETKKVEEKPKEVEKTSFLGAALSLFNTKKSESTSSSSSEESTEEGAEIKSGGEVSDSDAFANPIKAGMTHNQKCKVIDDLYYKTINYGRELRKMIEEAYACNKSINFLNDSLKNAASPEKFENLKKQLAEKTTRKGLLVNKIKDGQMIQTYITMANSFSVLDYEKTKVNTNSQIMDVKGTKENVEKFAKELGIQY